MKIKNLDITNFRCLKKKNIDTEKINIITGPNGSGKSSLLDAIWYALTGNIDTKNITKGEDHCEVSVVVDDGQDTIIKRTHYLPEEFMVNGESVKKNKFLEICESRKGSDITVILQETNPCFHRMSNTMLWEFLCNGTTSKIKIKGVKELSVETQDGITLYRRASSPSKITIDGKKTTGKMTSELIKDRMEGDPTGLELTTSSKLMNNMSMPDFAKILIGIIPVSIDFISLNTLAGLSKEESEILEQMLPKAPDPIVIKDVENAYKALYAKRASISALLDETKKRSVFTGALPLYSEKAAESELEEIQNEIGAEKEREKARISYKAAEEKRESVLKEIKSLEDIIALYPAVSSVSDAEIEECRKKQEEIREIIKMHESGIATLKSSTKIFSDTLDQINKGICPILKDKCLTDIGKYSSEYTERIQKNNDMIDRAVSEKERYTKCLNDEAEKEERLRKKKESYENKVRILEKLDMLKKHVPDLPEKPEEPKDLSSLIKKAEHLKYYINQNSVFKACEEESKKIPSIKDDYNLYNGLVRKAEPKKGLLTNTILSYILSPFKDYSNDFIKEIHGDAEIDFRMDDEGLQVYCRPHGKTDFLPISNLSSGEKLIVTICLMDLVSNITNSRILVFDQIEMMDKTALKHLFKFLASSEVQNRYDHIFLSSVDNEDIENCIKETAFFNNRIKL